MTPRETSGPATAAGPEPGSESPEGAGEPLVSLRGMTKRFAGITVLSEASIDLSPGEVHAVVGENGAGKSTLMKILAGAYQPDGGEIRLDGEAVSFRDPRDALARGIAIIYQEFNLLPERTVAENLFLGREPKRRFGIDRAAMRRRTQELLDQLSVENLSPDDRVGRLSVAQQQMVEITKALSHDARVVIMDEPTAPLPPEDVAALYERVRWLASQGIAVLYVSHRLGEVFDLADRVTVLKDGEQVATRPTGELTPDDLVTLMVGRELSDYYPPRAASEDLGEVAVRLTGASGVGLSGVDLTVRHGEIVGLAGLPDAGRHELVRALVGLPPFSGGDVEILGKPGAIRSPREAIACGVGYVSEDRKAEGLVLAHSIGENLLLPWRAVPPSGRETSERTQALRSVWDEVDIRAAGLDQSVRFVSGGNQQKAVLGKWLTRGVSVLILEEPTRGIDVGAKSGIHNVIRELARSGLAILMLSSELPEVIGMSDRIAVMREGRVVGELGADPTEAEVMTLATGQTEETAA